MSRFHSPEADKLVGHKFHVLDQGHVTLVDYMGNDSKVVMAARQSTTGKVKTPEEDRKFIAYLLSHGHGSPFEKVAITVEVKLPIFVARQWIRHRIASYNEFSGRYSEMKDEFYLPELARIQKQDKKNKQGSSGEQLTEDERLDVVADIREGQFSAHEAYKKILDRGVAKELSRITLPVSTYTQFWFTVNLRSLFNFLSLRLDSHAQWEIRQYAKVLHQIARAVAPMCMDAFEEHTLNAVTLSATEAEELRRVIRRDHSGSEGVKKIAEKLGVEAGRERRKRKSKEGRG